MKKKKPRTFLQRRSDAVKKYRTETKIRRHLLRTNDEARIIPIESVASNGVPDLNVQCQTGPNIWVELKAIRRKVVNSFSPKWRPNQREWATNHKIMSGAWILLISINEKLYYTTIPKKSYTLSEMKLFNKFDHEFLMDIL